MNIEEAFAALISFIFIQESIKKLLQINNDKKYSNEPSNYINDINKEINQQCFKCIDIDNKNNNYNNDTISSINLNLNKTECEALGERYEYRDECKMIPDVFFFSIVLYLITFTLAMSFRFFRTSSFFPSIVINLFRSKCLTLRRLFKKVRSLTLFTIT
jgi:hypothetical protein